MEEQDLRDDLECIAGLGARSSPSPDPGKAFPDPHYRFPPQDFKLANGDQCKRVDTLEGVGTIFSLDENAAFCSSSLQGRELPDQLSITGNRSIDTGVLQEAIRRFARDLLAGSGRYPAVQGILEKAPAPPAGAHSWPAHHRRGQGPLAPGDPGRERPARQPPLHPGPAGAGKTYVGSHVIVDLLRHGKRVA